MRLKLRLKGCDRFFVYNYGGSGKLETTPLRVVVSYAYLVFSQPSAYLHQAM